MQSQSAGFDSSEQKDIIREYFDLPLLRHLYQKKNRPLVYFGLPGAKALDVITWKEVIGEVIAVERNIKYLESLEDLLDEQLPELDSVTHWGSVDNIIISNRGKKRLIGGQEHWPMVGNCYEESIRGFVWRFDVVYLDYFGQLLPNEQDGGPAAAKRRAAALRGLFAIDRIDAWHPWILLVTVQAHLEEATRLLIREYALNTQAGASQSTQESLDFLLSDNHGPQEEETARLIHSAAAILVGNAAQNASLRVQPRGTVLYSGTGGRAMVHLAFEFTPDENPLGGYSDLASLLRAPIMKARNAAESPLVELLPQQCPEMTEDDIMKCLDFLEPDVWGGPHS